jgi:hypothetical protein
LSNRSFTAMIFKAHHGRHRKRSNASSKQSPKQTKISFSLKIRRKTSRYRFLQAPINLVATSSEWGLSKMLQGPVVMTTC